MRKSKLRLVGWVALAAASLPFFVLAVVVNYVGDLAYRVASDAADTIGAGIERHA